MREKYVLADILLDAELDQQFSDKKRKKASQQDITKIVRRKPKRKRPESDGNDGANQAIG